MSDAPRRPVPHANPRPGILKGLGICNILFSIFGFLCIFSSVFYLIAASTMNSAQAAIKVEVQAKPGPSTGTPVAVGFNPFMGMDDPNFMRFSIVENGTSVLVNGLMFATGIGLINLRAWGARWWGRLAWVKIVLAFLFWGYFIVGVVPSFSENMARNVSAMMVQQGMPAAKGPPIAMLTRVYSIMYLIMGLGMIVISSIYPAISVWMLSRPGVKAAILQALPSLEVEQP